VIFVKFSDSIRVIEFRGKVVLFDFQKKSSFKNISFQRCKIQLAFINFS
jgi:hypothetical protein